MGPGSVPGRGAKIPQAAWHSQKKKTVGSWVACGVEIVLVDTRAKGEADIRGVTDAVHCGFDRVRVTPHSLLNRVGSSP